MANRLFQLKGIDFGNDIRLDATLLNNDVIDYHLTNTCGRIPIGWNLLFFAKNNTYKPPLPQSVSAYELKAKNEIDFAAYMEKFDGFKLEENAIKRLPYFIQNEMSIEKAWVQSLVGSETKDVTIDNKISEYIDRGLNSPTLPLFTFSLGLTDIYILLDFEATKEYNLLSSSLQILVVSKNYIVSFKDNGFTWNLMPKQALRHLVNDLRDRHEISGIFALFDANLANNWKQMAMLEKIHISENAFIEMHNNFNDNILSFIHKIQNSL